MSKPDVLPYLPPGQGAVQLAVGSADVAPYRPALQFVHTVAPVREYLPAGQLTAVALTDAEGHTYPALQLPEQAAQAFSDIELTCRAALAPGGGVVVIAGTGSIAAFIDAARTLIPPEDTP